MTELSQSIVPCNFGIKFLQNREHGNVTLILKNEQKLSANSVILSLNSPVFERLTTELGLKTIEMKDFDETTAQRFIESFYTGKVEEIEEKDFRDMNKLSHVFKVVWIGAKCRNYFTDRLRSLNEGDFVSMIFLFDEVCFMEGVLKDSSLSNLAIRHIQHLDKGGCVVLKNYARKLVELSEKGLDLMILLAGNNISCLQKHILSEIKRSKAMHGNISYILNNIGLCIGKEQDADTFDELFETLRNMENLTTQDLRMVMNLYSKSMGDFCKRKEKTAVSCSRMIPNLFRRSFQDIESVMNPVSLACRDFVSIPELLNKVEQYADDMYMLVSVSCYIFTSFFKLYKVSCQDLSNKHTNGLVDKVIEQTVNELNRIRVVRGWSKICQGYFYKKNESVNYCLGNNSNETSVVNIVNKFIDKMKVSEITSGMDSAEICGPETKTLVFEEFLTVGRKYKFYFKHPDIETCSEPGNCGFLLEVTPALPGQPNNFNIELCTQPQEYATDIHFHDVVSADKMHFAINYQGRSDTESQLLSPSYLGKPAWEDDMIFWDFCKNSFMERKANWMRPIIYYDLTKG